MDPADGLLASGEPGVQRTWMDARVGDWVVTPRTGKAVEVNTCARLARAGAGALRDLVATIARAVARSRAPG